MFPHYQTLAPTTKATLITTAINPVKKNPQVRKKILILPSASRHKPHSFPRLSTGRPRYLASRPLHYTAQGTRIVVHHNYIPWNFNLGKIRDLLPFYGQSQFQSEKRPPFGSRRASSEPCRRAIQRTRRLCNLLAADAVLGLAEGRAQRVQEGVTI